MIRGHLLSAPSSLPLVVVDKLGVFTLHLSLKLPYDAKLVHGWCSRRESRNPLLDAALTANFRGLVLGCIEAKFRKKICVGIRICLKRRLGKRGHG